MTNLHTPTENHSEMMMNTNTVTGNSDNNHDDYE